MRHCATRVNREFSGGGGAAALEGRTTSGCRSQAAAWLSSHRSAGRRVRAGRVKFGRIRGDGLHALRMPFPTGLSPIRADGTWAAGIRTTKWPYCSLSYLLSKLKVQVEHAMRGTRFDEMFIYCRPLHNPS